jgi:TonB family protein
MTLGLFLLISFALHAIALSYPMLFWAPRVEEFFAITIVEPTRVNEDAKGPGTGGEGNTQQPARHQQTRLVKHPTRTTQANTMNRQEAEEFNPALIQTPAASEGFPLSPSTDSAAESDIDPSVPVGFAGTAAQAGAGTRGSLAGAGYGIGNGVGSTEGAQASLVGVSYAYNPPPPYPYSARKTGQEGTVLLRVLVDADGNSKALEVNHSSGFETLDKAAIATVRRWRFHSARYGDQRVEMWVKIPIVFRLAD